MKHELSRNNNYDFFEEAMHDFFPRFTATATGARRSICAPTSRRRTTPTGWKWSCPAWIKRDIHIDLKDGYLSITANKSEKNEGDKKDNYIHRERSFSCSRSYYVGDIRKEDIKAKYENGILNVCIPKEVKQKEEEHRIEIE